MSNKIIDLRNKKRAVAQGVGSEEVRAMAVKAARQAQQKIGGGMFGQVYETAPGVVTKEIALERKQKLLNEINMQARAAELGIAPQIQSASLMPPRVGQTSVAIRPPIIGQTVVDIEPGFNPNLRGEIEMQDLRTNYIPLGVNMGDPYAHYRTPDFTGGPPPGKLVVLNPGLTNQQIQKAKLDTHKQLAQLALNNISLTDRHVENIFVHKMTGRPIQIDFGFSEQIVNPMQKAAVLSTHVKNGLDAAGLPEEASIFYATTSSLLTTDPEMALDVAKQGLSRLQKIKAPIQSA